MSSSKRLMQGDDMEQNTLKFKYKVPDNYAPVYTNGCYGGKSPRGEIVINFFSERLPIPNSETFELDQGKIGDRINVDPEEMPIIRTISCGVIMSENNAREIYNWLGRVLGEKEE